MRLHQRCKTESNHLFLSQKYAALREACGKCPWSRHLWLSMVYTKQYAAELRFAQKDLPRVLGQTKHIQRPTKTLPSSKSSARRTNAVKQKHDEPVPWVLSLSKEKQKDTKAKYSKVDETASDVKEPCKGGQHGWKTGQIAFKRGEGSGAEITLEQHVTTCIQTLQGRLQL